jgi:hypothetical protein
VKELGGDFTISSTSAGTILRSAVPLAPEKLRADTPQITGVREVPSSEKHSIHLATNAHRVL